MTVKETNLTRDYLKTISGKFDVEAIFLLNLKEKSLNKMSAILFCVNLTVLNLSMNKMNNVSGIGVLKQLKYLDMSYNQITNIDEIEFLTNLKNIKLHGNKIDLTKNFQHKFKNLVNLEKLTFQEFDMNKKSQNPICRIQNYRKEMFNIFTNLKSLDFVRKECESLVECFKEKENLFEMFEVKKINFNEFDYDFREKLDFNLEKNIFDSERFEGVKQSLDDRYNLFKKELDGIIKNMN